MTVLLKLKLSEFIGILKTVIHSPYERQRPLSQSNPASSVTSEKRPCATGACAAGCQWNQCRHLFCTAQRTRKDSANDFSCS